MLRLHVATGTLERERLALGDSVAVSGVCLTLVGLDERQVQVQVSMETLRQTTLGGLTEGAAVNLEPALTLATPLGGHLMSGHVDGVAEVRNRGTEAACTRLRLAAPEPLARYLCARGSVGIDGVSLTVCEVRGNEFELNLIPHTLTHTTLGRLQPGDRANLEVDLLARYVERLLQGNHEPFPMGHEPEAMPGKG